MRSHQLGRAALAALFALWTCLAGVHDPIGAEEMRRDTLVLAAGDARHQISVEVAETPEEKAKGLMFRRTLADLEGMLFLYSEPQPVAMWMRNTYLALDMVFIDRAGTVIRIAERTVPFSEDRIESGGPVLAVLEINGGLAERLGLKPGDQVLHRAFGTAP
jgi:hypothetical protein